MHASVFSARSKQKPWRRIVTIDWGVVVATVVGPILAVWASEYRQRKRVQDDQKHSVFRTLMTTRAARMRLDHVMALNQIDFLFPRASAGAVQDAWGLYRNQLRTPQGEDEATKLAWVKDGSKLLDELIYQIGLSLKLPFSKTDIASASYLPDRYFMDDQDLQKARRLLLAVLEKGWPINVRVIDAVKQQPPEPSSGIL
jgi:uncharacterized protein DUF6680